MLKIRKYKLFAYLALFLLAIIIRILYLIEFSYSPLFCNISGPDVKEYYYWAIDIARGSLLWKTASIHSPLYSYFLALLIYLFKNSFFYIRFAQLFAGLLGFALLFVSIRKLNFDDKMKGFISTSFLIIALFYLPVIYYQAEIISEALLIPLLCVSIFYLYLGDNDHGYKKVYILIGGIFIGLGIITHPIAIFFLILESFYFLFGKNLNLKKSIVLIMIFIAPSLVIVLPVSIYNSLIDESVVFIQKNSGYNFYLGNNERSDGTCYILAGPQWEKVHRGAELNAELESLPKDIYFYSKSLDFITENPLMWGKLLFRKSLMFWNYQDLYSSMDPLNVKYFTRIISISMYFSGLFMAITLYGFIVLIFDRIERKNFIHFLILTLAVWAGLTFTVVSDRYRYIACAGYFALASYGCYHILFSNISNYIKVAVVFLSIIITYLPLHSINLTEDNAFANSMYGESYVKSGDYKSARLFLKRSMNVYPDWSRLYVNMGLSYIDVDNKIAENNFRSALSYNNIDSAAWYNLGVLYEASGQYRLSEKCFKQALNLEPTNKDFLYSLALLLYRNGEYKNSVTFLNNAVNNNISNNQIYNLLGVLYLKTGEPAKAVHALRMSLKSISDIKVKLNLAAAYLDLKKYTEAESLIYDIIPSVNYGKEAELLLQKINNAKNKMKSHGRRK